MKPELVLVLPEPLLKPKPVSVQQIRPQSHDLKHGGILRNDIKICCLAQVMFFEGSTCRMTQHSLLLWRKVAMEKMAVINIFGPV